MHTVKYSKAPKIHDADELFSTDRATLLRLQHTYITQQQQDRQQTNDVLTETHKTPNSSGHSVQFGDVHIREYERSIGGGPCSNGPPIGLGWKYWAFEPMMSTTSSNYDPASNRTEAVIPLEEYEIISCPRRLSLRELVLSRQTREELLRENGFAQSELAEAVRKNIKLKQQRRQTTVNLWLEPYEASFERCYKAVKKMLIPNAAKWEDPGTIDKSTYMEDDEWDVDRKSLLSVSVGQTLAPKKGILKHSVAI